MVTGVNMLRYFILDNVMMLFNLLFMFLILSSKIIQ